MRGEKLAKSSGTFRSFKHRNFRIFFIASFCSNIGTWVQRIAQDWLVLELTNDAFQLGIVTGLQALPFIFFSSFGGKLADRFPKRKLLIIANSTVALWALILGVLVISGNVQIWHVYIIALLLGISSSIEAPIAQAFVTQIVPPEDMANAISLRAVNFNSARLIGPAVSGFMISAFGTGPSFIFISISFVFILSALFFMRTGGITELNPEQGKVYIREALNYIRARPDLKALMLLTFFFATFGFNPELFSATMATMAFGKDAKEFGLLGSCIAVGSLSGSLLATKLEWKPGTKRVIASSIGFGFAIIIGSLAPSYTFYAIALPLFGAGMLTTGIAANRTAQLGSDPLIRGRVMGIYFAIFMGGTPIGAPFIGWLAEIFGPRQALITAGLIVIFGSLFVAWRFRGRLEPPEDVSLSATFDK